MRKGYVVVPFWWNFSTRMRCMMETLICMFRMRKKEIYREDLARDVIDWLLFGIKWISNREKTPRGAFNSHGFIISKQKHVDANATPISLSTHLYSIHSSLYSLSHPKIKKAKLDSSTSRSHCFCFNSQFNSMSRMPYHRVCLNYLTTSREKKNKLIHIDYVHVYINLTYGL